MRTQIISLSVVLLAGCPPIDAKVDAKANTNVNNTTTNTTINNGGGEDSGTDPASARQVKDDAGQDLIEADPTVEGDAGVEEPVTEDAGVEPPPPPPCTIGQTVCNGTQVQACDGKKWVNGKFCTLGCDQGVCNVCDPGAIRCTGSTIETCIGTGWAVTTTCSYTCSEGVCADQLCEPGALLCDQDGNVTKCSDNGLAWAPQETCTTGCTDGLCNACTDTSLSCDGKTPRLCVAGQWQAQTECAAGCALGTCSECQPGDRSCSDHDGGTFAQLCDDTGHWVDDTECVGSSPFCTSGECGECDPGTAVAACLTELLCEYENGRVVGEKGIDGGDFSNANCRKCDPSTDPTCVEVTESTPVQTGCWVDPTATGSSWGTQEAPDGERECYPQDIWANRTKAGWFFVASEVFHHSCSPTGHLVNSACQFACIDAVGCYGECDPTDPYELGAICIAMSEKDYTSADVTDISQAGAHGGDALVTCGPDYTWKVNDWCELGCGSAVTGVCGSWGCTQYHTDCKL